MKSEIEKIKAVLSEINKRNVEKLISTNGNNYSMIKILSNPDITNITKALEVAVDEMSSFIETHKRLGDNQTRQLYRSEIYKSFNESLKQISEILEVK